MNVTNVEFITKTLIPQAGNRVVRRQRLIDLLHDHVPLRAQVVCAPAGYGKTTLLVDFASDLDVPVCWYSIDSSDQDPTTLLEGILSSIRSRFPSFGRLTSSRLPVSADTAKEASQLVRTLTGEIYSGIPDYFVLVLEDSHFLEGSEPAKAVLDLVLQHAPDNCHIIISCRALVELPALSKLFVQGLAAKVSTPDLSFTSEEVKNLLNAYHGIDLTGEQVSRLVAATDGWIIGILLEIDHLRGRALDKQSPSFSSFDVLEYLKSQVLDKQPPEIRSFLLATSILDFMEPEVCERLLEVSQSKRMLRLIEQQNLFTQRIDGEKNWYRYHHLFRGFLRDWLLEEDPTLFFGLHAKVALIFEERGQWNDAITHYLTAKKHDEAARVIATVGERYLKSGKWTTLSNWIEALPAQTMYSNPELVLLQAESLIHLGKSDEAACMLTILLDQMTGDKDWLYRAKALSRRSAAFRLTGHLPEAKRDIRIAIRLLREHKGPAEVLGDAHRRLGNILGEEGRFDLALTHLRRGLRHYTSTFDVGESAAVHNSLGIVYKRLGQLPRANVHFSKAREAWLKTENFGALAATLNNIGIVYQRQGQYDLALDAFRSGLEKARATGYRRMEACILISMAELLRDLGSYDEALNSYQAGLQLAREVMEAYYVACATAGISETYRLIGATEKAEVLLKEALYQAEEQGQNYDAALFTTQLAVIEYQRHQYDTAMAILYRAGEHLQKFGDKDALAKVYFHSAQASFLAKKYETALEWLEQASRLADELGYEEFLVVEGKNATALIQFGALRNVGGGRFTRIIKKIRLRRNLSAMGQGGGVSVSPGRPEVEAYAFGDSRVLVNSHPITEAQWRSSRAKEVFFYLLSVSTRQTREQIATALWPDASPAKGASNLHISLYRARRAVFPGIFTFEEGRYRLNSDLNVWFDAAEFESLFIMATRLPPDNQDRILHLESALKLYVSPFLSEFYSDWSQARRRELEDKYLRILCLLAKYYADRKDYGKAMSLLEKLMGIDPYNDEAYTQMMKLQLAEGDTTSAVRTYRRYLEIAGDTPDLTVPPQLRQLHRRV